MKKKYKIILDIIMLILTVTLFNKRIISMKYHEVAGIILVLLTFIHIAFNMRIAVAMCKNIQKVPLSIKIGVIVDILLMICFVWIGISGVLISHTILTGISSGNVIFKIGHMFAGGLSVIFLGIHIGLHICRKPMPTAFAAVFTAVMLIGGIYGAVSSSEVRFLSMPFTANISAGSGQGQSQGNTSSEGKQQNNNTQKPENVQNNGDTQTDNTNTSEKSAPKGRNMPALGMAERAQNVIVFFCMIMMCAMVTYWIVIFKRRNNKNVN